MAQRHDVLLAGSSSHTLHGIVLARRRSAIAYGWSDKGAGHRGWEKEVEVVQRNEALCSG